MKNLKPTLYVIAIYILTTKSPTTLINKLNKIPIDFSGL
jgi:hypothetical protein